MCNEGFKVFRLEIASYNFEDSQKIFQDFKKRSIRFSNKIPPVPWKKDKWTEKKKRKENEKLNQNEYWILIINKILREREKRKNRVW